MDSQYQELSGHYDSKTDDYYYNSRTEMVRFIPKGTQRVLDVGCSTGRFGANLKRLDNDIQVWGIEPFASAAGEAAKVLDKVICSTLEKNMSELEGEQFDVIVFNDVLEHLTEPGSVLTNCKKYLRPGGVVLASIPNILYFPIFFNQIIIREDWKYTDEGTLDNTHVRFFTRKSIIRLFEDQQYHIQSITGINAFVPKYYWLLNWVTFNKLKEWRYRQYAIVAKPFKD